MDDNREEEKQSSKLSKYTMKTRRTHNEGKPITITAERLSDNSRITFTISSDKTIDQLRALLNHHLPPLIPNTFHLYSYQRGARINFHPSSFKLDYFPVIFDQSVLLLKMDDRIDNDDVANMINIERKSTKNHNSCLINKLFPSKSTTNKNLSAIQEKSPVNVTCLSLFKAIFQQKSTNVNNNDDIDTLTY